jgi:chromate transporter
VGAAAWAYVRFGKLPEVTGLLYGIKPVVIAIIIQALVSLARSALKTGMLALLLVAATIAAAVGVNELAVLAASGALMALTRMGKRAVGSASVIAVSGFGASAAGAVAGVAAAGSAAPFAYGTLFWVFFKVGAVLFGSGYVLLAFLRADLVDRLGWLTERQLLDATAIGQVTPGPVFTTATFIGYLLGGAQGAAVATIGIFLPAFLFVAASGPLVPRLRRSPVAGAVLDGVTIASLALMAVVSFQLGRAALVDPLTLLLALASFVLLVRFRVNSTWLILGGAVIGWLATTL